MKKSLILLFSFLILFACKKDNNGSGRSFDQVVQDGGDFQAAVQSEDVVDSSETNDVVDGEVWNCTTTTYNAMEPGGGSKGFPLFNPNASVIYPGSLLQGKSLKKATPDVIAVGRAGGTISYDLVNGNTSSSFSVDVVSKSAIQDAMNQIIANSPQSLPANFVFTYDQVQSEQALALKLGIDYETAFTDISSDFSFSSNSSLNRVLVELNQSFYTMSFDIPTSLSGLFASSVTPADLAKYVQPGNPATYISDVTYGRIYYMLVESSSSYTEMEAQINASFSGVVNSAEADISANSLSKLKNLKIKVMAFGGEATTSLLTVGETNLSVLVNLLAESTTISTGVPISYVVRSVNSNQIVSTQLATQYDVTNCEPAPPGGEPPFTAHWKGRVLNEMGPVGAAYAVSGTEFILISKDGTQYMRSDIGVLEGPFPVDSLGGGPPPFKIGAACNIDGNDQTDPWIMIMDVTGGYYSYITGQKQWSGNGALPISNLAEGNNPFALNGIGAMLFNYKSPDGPANRYMINKDGTYFSLYSNNPNQYGKVYPITDWAGGGLPLASKTVGAGIGFYLGNNQFFLLFNGEGTQYCISGDVFGTGGHDFIGPFDL
jgi:thiol-activated cytolysin